MISLTRNSRLIYSNAKEINDCLGLRVGMGINWDARKPFGVTNVYDGYMTSQNSLKLTLKTSAFYCMYIIP